MYTFYQYVYQQEIMTSSPYTNYGSQQWYQQFPNIDDDPQLGSIDIGSNVKFHIDTSATEWSKNECRLIKPCLTLIIYCA